MVQPKTPAPLFPAILLAGTVMISLGPLLDGIIADSGIRRAEAGALSLAFFFGMNAALLLMNAAFGGLSSKRTLLIGAASQALGLLLFGGWARSLAGLCLANGLTGFGYGVLCIFPGMHINSLMKEGTERAMSLVYGLFGVGVTITPVLIGRLLEWGVTWRAVLVGQAGLSALLGAYLLLAPIQDVPGRRNVRTEEVASIWRHNRSLFLVLLGAMLLYIGAEGAFNVWLPKFQIDTFGAGPSRAGLSITLLWAGITAGRLLAVPILHRFRPYRVASLACVGMAVSIAGVGLAPTPRVMEILCLAAGLSASVIFPIVSSYCSDFPAWLSGVVYAAIVFAGGLGTMLFPYLVGPLADLWGFRAAITIGIGPILLVGALILMARRTSSRARRASKPVP